jgi:Cysteine rich repeat
LLIVRAAAVACVLVASGVMASSAAAQTRGFFDFFSELLKGTPEEEAACKPDVTKYCQDAVPDTFRVLGCLKQQRKRLSKPCLAVLESHGQ